MAFSRPTLETIYGRIKADMESRLTKDVKIPRFSLLGITAIVFAGCTHLLYGYLGFISDQLFVDSCNEEWLIRLANIYGVPQKSAEFAEGRVKFTGTSGAVIAEGAKLQNGDGITFLTLEEVTIVGTTIEADIQAENAGVSGNISDTSIFFVSSLSDVDSEVEVITAPVGGQDRESLPDLRLRLLQRLQNPPASGNKGDYVRWALSVAGVSKAWVLSAAEYGGAGTVAISAATSTLDPIDSVTKTNLEEYIAAEKPIGSNADVKDVITQAVSYFISIPLGTVQEAKDKIDSNLRTLHLTESEPGGALLLSHIRSAIATSGVLDYEITDITVESGSIGVVNVQMTGFDIAQFESAVLTEDLT